jgi:hypothetical protein
MTRINKPFYTRANGAVKCTETEDGYALTVNYGSLDHRYVLTTYFAGLDDMAEYIYFTAATENESVLSIMAELEKALKAKQAAAR